MCIARRAKRPRRSADLETSAVRLVHAFQYADQGRLSRAVLADERKDLARPNHQTHVFKRLNDAKPLGYGSNTDDGDAIPAISVGCFERARLRPRRRDHPQTSPPTLSDIARERALPSRPGAEFNPTDLGHFGKTLMFFGGNGTASPATGEGRPPHGAARRFGTSRPFFAGSRFESARHFLQSLSLNLGKVSSVIRSADT